MVPEADLATHRSVASVTPCASTAASTPSAIRSPSRLISRSMAKATGTSSTAMLETRPAILMRTSGAWSGALVDVVLETGGRAVGERGDGEQDGDGQNADEQPHEVGGAVHARREQRFVPGDAVGVFGRADGGEGGADQMVRAGLLRRLLVVPLLRLALRRG